jgi:hypothetical protein
MEKVAVFTWFFLKEATLYAPKQADMSTPEFKTSYR